MDRSRDRGEQQRDDFDEIEGLEASLESRGLTALHLIATAFGGEAMPPSTYSGAETSMNS